MEKQRLCLSRAPLETFTKFYAICKFEKSLFPLVDIICRIYTSRINSFTEKVAATGNSIFLSKLISIDVNASQRQLYRLSGS
jgi:hypothetical protein